AIRRETCGSHGAWRAEGQGPPDEIGGPADEPRTPAAEQPLVKVEERTGPRGLPGDEWPDRIPATDYIRYPGQPPWQKEGDAPGEAGTFHDHEVGAFAPDGLEDPPTTASFGSPIKWNYTGYKCPQKGKKSRFITGP